jgi:beta-lactamase class A
MASRVTVSRIRLGSARLAGFLACAAAVLVPVSSARAGDLEAAFDKALGARTAATQSRGTQAQRPQSGAPQVPSAQVALPTTSPFTTQPQGTRSYASPFEAQLAALSDATEGRIGVAAIDLSTGRGYSVLGSQPFPLASTSKIAIAATFLSGVDRGQYKLTDMYPLMVPVPSRKFDGAIAPVRAGEMVDARTLIDLALTRSDNQATDALLAAVGGPSSVNRWLRQSGIENFRIDRDIATLVRDDGAFDPAKTIDSRDSTTPVAMVRLLTGLFRGDWLSPDSRTLLLSTMERCVTGKRRIPGQLPEGTRIAHKTGTLSNTTSDVGFVQLPDGRTVAMAIYVTGQGGRASREARIAAIARTIYDGYGADAISGRTTAAR